MKKPIIAFFLLALFALALYFTTPEQTWIKERSSGGWDRLLHSDWKTTTGRIYGTSSSYWYNDDFRVSGRIFGQWAIPALWLSGDMSFVSLSMVLRQTVTLTLEEGANTAYVKIQWEEQFRGYPLTRFYRISIWFKQVGLSETNILTTSWLSSTTYNGKFLFPTYFQQSGYKTEIVVNAFAQRKTGALDTLLSYKKLPLTYYFRNPRLRQSVIATFYSSGGFGAYIQGTKTETLSW